MWNQVYITPISMSRSSHFSLSRSKCSGRGWWQTPVIHLVLEAVLQALHRLAVDMLASAALVADDFISLDADERRDVAAAAKLLSDFVGDEVAIVKTWK